MSKRDDKQPDETIADAWTRAVDVEAREAIVESRGSAPVKAKGQKPTRSVTVVDAEGKPLRNVAHGDLVAGLLAREGIEDAVVEGRRPKFVRCLACGKRIAVGQSREQARQPLPTNCRSCKAKAFQASRTAEERSASSRISAAKSRDYLSKRMTQVMNDPQTREFAAARLMASNASRTHAEKTEWGRRALAARAINDAERSADELEARAARARKRQSESMKATLARLTPEQRSERIRRINDSKTPDERRQIAIRRAAAKTVEQRSETARKANASMTAEQRRARALKVWETRRSRAAAKAAEQAAKTEDPKETM